MPSSNFNIQIAHSVKEIGQETWDYLAGKHPLASYRWYRFGETVLTKDTPIYIILSQGNEPVGRATFWLKRQEPVPISSRLTRFVIEVILRHWPLLVCRTPLTDITGLILPAPPLHQRALETIAEIAQEQARQHRASFLLFDYLDNDVANRAGWPCAFSSAMIQDSGTQLTIAWTDFESYLKQLTKSTRRSYRLNRNRAADLGIEVKLHRTATALDEAITLIQNVDTHHNSPSKPWMRRMLANVSMVDATWLTAEIAGRLVGCTLLAGEGDTRLLTLLGLDYGVKYAYFQLVYASIRRAIEEGTRILRAGSGAYDLKRRLGFELEHNNYVTYATQSRGLYWIARQLTLT